MPVKAVGNKIVEKSTGKVIAEASSKSNAKKSANVRNAVRHGWKPRK